MRWRRASRRCCTSSSASAGRRSCATRQTLPRRCCCCRKAHLVALLRHSHRAHPHANCAAALLRERHHDAVDHVALCGLAAEHDGAVAPHGAAAHLAAVVCKRLGRVHHAPDDHVAVRQRRALFGQPVEADLVVVHAPAQPLAPRRVGTVQRVLKALTLHGAALAADGLEHAIHRHAATAALHRRAVPNDGVFLAPPAVRSNGDDEVLAHGPVVHARRARNRRVREWLLRVPQRVRVAQVEACVQVGCRRRDGLLHHASLRGWVGSACGERGTHAPTRAPVERRRRLTWYATRGAWSWSGHGTLHADVPRNPLGCTARC